ncbi:MAG: hypothetical protein WC838_05245, partial [Candidatus Margulisiibacteriota bacterium]
MTTPLSNPNASFQVIKSGDAYSLDTNADGTGDIDITKLDDGVFVGEFDNEEGQDVLITKEAKGNVSFSQLADRASSALEDGLMNMRDYRRTDNFIDDPIGNTYIENGATAQVRLDIETKGSIRLVNGTPADPARSAPPATTPQAPSYQPAVPVQSAPPFIPTQTQSYRTALPAQSNHPYIVPQTRSYGPNLPAANLFSSIADRIGSSRLMNSGKLNRSALKTLVKNNPNLNGFSALEKDVIRYLLDKNNFKRAAGRDNFVNLAEMTTIMNIRAEIAQARASFNRPSFRPPVTTPIIVQPEPPAPVTPIVSSPVTVQPEPAVIPIVTQLVDTTPEAPIVDSIVLEQLKLDERQYPADIPPVTTPSDNNSRDLELANARSIFNSFSPPVTTPVTEQPVVTQPVNTTPATPLVQPYASEPTPRMEELAQTLIARPAAELYNAIKNVTGTLGPLNSGVLSFDDLNALFTKNPSLDGFSDKEKDALAYLTDRNVFNTTASGVGTGSSNAPDKFINENEMDVFLNSNNIPHHVDTFAGTIMKTRAMNPGVVTTPAVNPLVEPYVTDGPGMFMQELAPATPLVEPYVTDGPGMFMQELAPATPLVEPYVTDGP